MPDFEQNLSICVIISRVALISARGKHCTGFGSSESELGRGALSSLEGEPRHRSEGMQILSQLWCCVDVPHTLWAESAWWALLSSSDCFRCFLLQFGAGFGAASGAVPPAAGRTVLCCAAALRLRLIPGCCSGSSVRGARQLFPLHWGATGQGNALSCCWKQFPLS